MVFSVPFTMSHSVCHAPFRNVSIFTSLARNDPDPKVIPTIAEYVVESTLVISITSGVVDVASEY